MLMRGFTTVRDMAGDTGDLKRLIDAGASPGPRIYPSPASAEKNRQVCAGVERVFGWALDRGVRLAFGTDLMLNPAGGPKQSEMLTRLAGLAGLAGGPKEGLKVATSGSAALFREAGPRDPHQNPAANLKVIIKDGRIYKNTLP